MAITGNGNASKEQVAAMLESRFKMKLDQKYLDASDALAAAVCHYQRISSPAHQLSTTKHRDWKSFVKANEGRVANRSLKGS